MKSTNAVLFDEGVVVVVVLETDEGEDEEEEAEPPRVDVGAAAAGAYRASAMTERMQTMFDEERMVFEVGMIDK